MNPSTWLANRAQLKSNSHDISSNKSSPSLAPKNFTRKKKKTPSKKFFSQKKILAASFPADTATKYQEMHKESNNTKKMKIPQRTLLESAWGMKNVRPDNVSQLFRFHHLKSVSFFKFSRWKEKIVRVCLRFFKNQKFF